MGKLDRALNPIDYQREVAEQGNTMNKGFITDRLVALGYTVDKAISPSTDFLVLGDKEEGEFAQNLTDTDEYKLADKLGVQIVRIDDILDFIRF